MLDPLSPLTAPPPRYLIESDSSDEEGEGLYTSKATHHGRRHRAPPPPPQVDVRIVNQVAVGFANVHNVVVGIGQAGKYLVRRAAPNSPSSTVMEIEVAGKRVGSGFQLGSDLLVLVQEWDEKGNGVFDVVDHLMRLIPAPSWTLFSSYVPSMYIPDPLEELLSLEPPVRYLSVSGGVMASPLLKQYDAPNYVTGIAGAFLSLSSHPASPLPPTANVNIFLLPLPLSALSQNALAAALDTISPAVVQRLGRYVSWSEVDDEPYAQLGMGSRRPPPSASPSTNDLTGMYM